MGKAGPFQAFKILVVSHRIVSIGSCILADMLHVTIIAQSDLESHHTSVLFFIVLVNIFLKYCPGKNYNPGLI